MSALSTPNSHHPARPLRVVLATFGSHGDVHPFVGLGLTLKARGHDVVLHTSEYFRGLAEQAGLAFSGYGTREDFQRGITNKLLWHPRKGYKAVFGIGVREGLRKSYDELSRVVDPDTVLVNSSLSLAARVPQDKLGCPGATVHLSPSVLRSSVSPPRMNGVFMPSWMPLDVRKKIWETGDRYFVDPLICPTLNALRAEQGLPPVDRVLNGWWNHPHRVIGLWPDWYAPVPSDWPPQFRNAGFPLYDESDVTPLPDDLEAFLNAPGGPPVAFTPGSAMLFGGTFFRAAARACAALGRRGVLLTRHPAQIPTHLPPGVIHCAYAPFSKLLPRCAAVVHHGGIGTTAQGLRAGIPQVVTHFSHDQPDNTLRLRRLGVGTGLAAGNLALGPVGTWRLTRALRALLEDPHVADTCKAVRARFTSDSGLDRACDLIEAAAPTPA